MHWNHRVIKKTNTFVVNEETVSEDYYEIVEVFYNQEDKPFTYCDANTVGDTLEGIQENINRFQEALKHPILTTEDFQDNFADDEG